MKPNQLQTSRPAAAEMRFVVVVALAFWLGALPSLLAQAVPDRMNYQGILLNGQGAPITTPTDIEFRIWDSASLTDTNGLKWGRIFRITPDTNGAFNVVLSSEGAAVSYAPDVSLYSVFTSPGSDSRYLELTVAGSTAIRPRQRFVASPYAMLAYDLTPRVNFTVGGVLTVSGAANVNSLTTPGAVTATTVAATTVSATSLTATSAIAGQLTVTGAAEVGSLNSSGAITASSSTVTASNFVGFGTIPIGGIIMWSGSVTNVPNGWALCNGGTTNGVVIPDLRGRFVLAQGTGAGLTTRTVGQTGGEQTHVLTVSEMPSHKHYVSPAQARQDEYGFGGSELHFAIGASYPGQEDYITPTGGDQPHNTMPPYYVLAFIIRVR